MQRKTPPVIGIGFMHSCAVPAGTESWSDHLTTAFPSRSQNTCSASVLASRGGQAETCMASREQALPAHQHEVLRGLLLEAGWKDVKL